MPSPRETAKQKNPAANFGTEASDYCAKCGHPHGPGLPSCGAPPDYAANPTNPPAASVEAKNLKGS